MNERDDPTLKEFAGYYEATEPGYRERAILAALKKKAGLKRRGSRKSGEWYFE